MNLSSSSNTKVIEVSLLKLWKFSSNILTQLSYIMLLKMIVSSLVYSRFSLLSTALSSSSPLVQSSVISQVICSFSGYNIFYHAKHATFTIAGICDG